MIKAVEFVCNNKCLRGTMHVPYKENKKFPIVIMFHGFGANRIEHYSSFVKVSNLLAENNIACIRFDFSGHGESDGDFYDVTLSNEVVEGKAIVEFVKSLNFVDKDNINLLGMSLGGVVASVVAGEIKEQIKSLCMWAPAAAALDEININGTLQGKSIKEIEEKGYLDFHSHKVSPRFIEDIKTFNLYDKAKLFDKDVKIIHGDKDWIAPIKYSNKYIECYEGRGELHTIIGADHSFGTVEERNELFDETLKFFKKIL